MTSRKHSARALLAGAVVPLAAACDPTTATRICSQVGCTTHQLTVSLQERPAGAYRVEVQAAGAAAQVVTCPDASRCPSSLPFLDVSSDVVTVIVTTDRGTVRHEVRPTYIVVRPNGPHCEPECRQRSVQVSIPG